MRVNDSFHDVQTESYARRGSAQTRIHAVKTLEDVLLLFFRNAYALVVDRDTQLVAHCLDADPDR